MEFINIADKEMNTVMPNDYSAFEKSHALFQNQRVTIRLKDFRAVTMCASLQLWLEQSWQSHINERRLVFL